MLWTLSPYDYQVHHPWHWLTYGQNAMALASLIAVVTSFSSLIVALATLTVVARQSKAANRQAAASEAQVKSAKDASDVSRALLAATERAADAERYHSELIRVQILESLRPVLAVTNLEQSEDLSTLTIQNQGRGVALDLHVKFKPFLYEPSFFSHNLIGAGGSARLAFGGKAGTTELITLIYQSVDGRYFMTKIAFANFGYSQSVEEVDAAGNPIGHAPIPLHDL